MRIYDVRIGFCASGKNARWRYRFMGGMLDWRRGALEVHRSAKNIAIRKYSWAMWFFRLTLRAVTNFEQQLTIS